MMIDVDFTTAQVTRIKAAVRKVRGLAAEPTNAELQAMFAEVAKREARAIVHRADKIRAEEAIQPL